MRKVLTALVATAVVVTSPASAAVNIVVEGGGTPVVFQGSNGNRFGLVGLDARRRDADSIANLPAFTVDRNYIISRLSDASSFVNAYSCSNFSSGGSCAPLASVLVPDEARLFDSLLLEFNSTGNIVFNNPTGSTTTLALGRVTRNAPPPIGTAVPEPGTWMMLLLGFFGVGGLLRGRRRDGSSGSEALA